MYAGHEVDARGHFLIEGLPAGSYELRAIAYCGGIATPTRAAARVRKADRHCERRRRHRRYADTRSNAGSKSITFDDETPVPPQLVGAAILVELSRFDYSRAVAEQMKPNNGSSKGAITGRVVDQNGQPLANALVSVRSYGVNAPRRDKRRPIDEGNFQASRARSFRVYRLGSNAGAMSPPPRS